MLANLPSTGRASGVCLLALLVTASCAVAQHPATSPVVTVWQRLGIPQTYTRVRDATLNRNGNFPGLERKPPLKKIADPENLESDNDAIRSAAEVKQEEDLAEQKIKALKYLATIGCGCYDKDGKIEAALLAGLKDCTPDVRMAAVDALIYIVGSCDPQSQYGYCPTGAQKLKACLDEYCACDDVMDKIRMMGVGKKCKNLIYDIRQARACQCRKCRSRRNACAGCCGHCCTLKIHKRLAEMAFEEEKRLLLGACRRHPEARPTGAVPLPPRRCVRRSRNRFPSKLGRRRGKAATSRAARTQTARAATPRVERRTTRTIPTRRRFSHRRPRKTRRPACNDRARRAGVRAARRAPRRRGFPLTGAPPRGRRPSRNQGRRTPRGRATATPRWSSSPGLVPRT